MRSTRTLPLALLGAALLAVTACGPGDAEDTGEAAGAAESAAQAEPAQDLPCFMQAESMAEAQDRPSPLQTTTIALGGQEAVLCYGAPSARDRAIMGELVPFDTPWRMGANEATAIHLPFGAQIGDVTVEPGAYSLWAVPGPDEWEIHVNGTVERWGIPINDEVQADDVGTFTVTPSPTDAPVETLTYRWQPEGEDMGHLVMEWEDTRVEIPIHAAGMQM